MPETVTTIKRRREMWARGEKLQLPIKKGQK